MARSETQRPEFRVVWARDSEPGRGPKPSRSREEIAAAAVRVADADGISAVSMRRVAAELGAGTASLYRYLATKEDLFDLMVDAAQGEIDLDGVPSGDWRADLARLANGTRSVMQRHRWLATLAGGRPTYGPNTLRMAERVLAALDGHGLDIDQMMVMQGTLSAFVRGYVTDELAEHEFLQRLSIDRDDWMHAHGEYLFRLVATGEFPLIGRLILDAEAPHDPDRDDHAFAAGLERVLDGIAAAMPTKQRSPARAARTAR